MAPSGMAPCRSSTAGERVTSTIEDSMPKPVGPPSITRSMRPPRLFITWSAVVGEIAVERFALGAAMGSPAASSSEIATGCAGTRRATVGPPAAASATTPPSPSRRATTSVSGPGQKARGEALGRVRPGGGDLARGARVCDVHDERVARGPALGRVDRAHGVGVVGAGAEAVHRLGGEGDEAPPTDPLRCARDGPTGAVEPLGHAPRCPRRSRR